MDDLTKLEGIVKDILEENEECRNSDNFLYMVYLSENNPQVLNIPVIEYFGCFKDYNIARFESVARARRKVQELYPHLMGCESVRKWRNENETKFKDYARR